MKNILQILALASIAVTLVSCGVGGFGDHDQDYVKAGSVQAMVIPRGVGSPIKNHYYSVPDYHVKVKEEPISLLPPGNNIAHYQ